MNATHRYDGFTLTEMLVTLAVSAILAIAAWPVLRDMHATLTAMQTADQLASSLALARSVAANRRMEVQIGPLPGTDVLHTGWQLATISAQSGSADPPLSVVRLGQRCARVVLRGTAGATGSQHLRLTAVGYSRSERGGFFAATFQVSCGQALRQVRLGAQGRIRICQPGKDVDCE